MDVPDTLKRAFFHRGIVTGSFLVGWLLILGGLVAGFSLSIPALLRDPTALGDAFEVTSPALTAALVALGVLVWQVGKSYALFVTLPPAAGEAAADGVDTERLKSEMLQVLDDRLADVHEELEETRRGVQELKRAEHAAQLEADPVGGSASNATTDAGRATEGAAANGGRESEGTEPNAPGR